MVLSAADVAPVRGSGDDPDVARRLAALPDVDCPHAAVLRAAGKRHILQPQSVIESDSDSGGRLGMALQIVAISIMNGCMG